MQTRYEKKKTAQIGESVYVTVTGSTFYKGTVMSYGAYDFYPSKRSYQVEVQRDKEYSFIEYFDEVYKEA